MKFQYKNILLRDMVEEDIEDYVRWFTIQTEWAEFDAPWEPIDPEESTKENWTEYYNEVRTLSEDTLRWKFEIEINGKLLGWVSSYLLDENYEWISSDMASKTARRAIGINICENDFWSKGIGAIALEAFLEYYLSLGYQEIYTQTWSGNIRMIKVATKLGFKICHTRKNLREVHGKRYDALTFVYHKTI